MAYGLCDYNYWGGWVLNVKDVLEMPFVTLVRLFPHPEGIVVVALAMPALVLNVFLWGSMLGSLIPRKRGPNHAPDRMPGTNAPGESGGP